MQRHVVQFLPRYRKASVLPCSSQACKTTDASVGSLLVYNLAWSSWATLPSINTHRNVELHCNKHGILSHDFALHARVVAFLYILTGAKILATLGILAHDTWTMYEYVARTSAKYKHSVIVSHTDTVSNVKKKLPS